MIQNTLPVVKKVTIKSEWNKIIDLACEHTNHVMARNMVMAELKKNEITCLLEQLIDRFGNLPEFLATLGEYTVDPSKKLTYFNDAFIGFEMKFANNMALSCATSALRYCLDSNLPVDASVWRARVSDYKEKSDDKWEISEALDLLRELDPP